MAIHLEILSFTLLFFTLLLLPTRFNPSFQTIVGTDVSIIGFYSCDALGDSQDYFPKGTTAHFNVSVRNFAHDSKTICIQLSVQDELDVPIGSDQLSTTIPAVCSEHYIMNIIIPKWALVGVATARVSVLIQGSTIDNEHIDFYIGPEDLTPPVIHLLRPENSTYTADSVPLIFTVYEKSACIWTGYSLNNVENISISGNTTLTDLTNGTHNIILYANDTSGNMGCSETVYFTISILHEVAVIGLNCSSTRIYAGKMINITLFVQNVGTVTETFDVTVYANISTIGTLTNIELTKGNFTNLTLTWNTIGFAKGNCTIWAYAKPVPHETNTADNIFIDGTIYVAITGDINANGAVDIFDAILLSTAVGTEPGNWNWNPNADINGDLIVDIWDAVTLSVHTGEKIQ